MDKSLIIDRLLLLISHTKIKSLAVHHMLSCFLVKSHRFSTLMRYNVDGVECFMAAPRTSCYLFRCVGLWGENYTVVNWLLRLCQWRMGYTGYC